MRDQQVPEPAATRYRSLLIVGGMVLGAGLSAVAGHGLGLLIGPGWWETLLLAGLPAAAGGGLAGWLCDRRDRTARALQASERRLRELMENVHMVALTFDLAGRITFCNEYFARLTGWEREEILGQLWVEVFVPPEERTERSHLLQDLMDGQEVSYHLEREILTRSDERRVIAWNLFPLHQGEKVIGLAGLGEDITLQRRAAQDVDRRMQELAALQRAGRFITSSLEQTQVLGGITSAARLMLGSRCSAILLHDPVAGELEYVTVECGRVEEGEDSGCGAFPAPGQRIPQDAGAPGWILAHCQALVLNGQTGETLPFTDPDWSPRALAAVPLRYKETSLGVMQVERSSRLPFNDHDVTILSTLADFAAIAVMTNRLVEAEREQRRLVERSQAQLMHSEKLNSMGRLVAFLAHEINNPLQALQGGFNLLLNCPLSEEKKREYLELSNREVERLTNIVARVLSYNRRAAELTCPVDLHLLLEETVRLVERRLERTNVRVERCYATDLPQVEGYFDQLHQVFLNLILNALSAMPNGGRLMLTTVYDEHSGRVCISVGDSGAGIEPESLPHIFEPFFTTRPDGSGLGLAISSDIIDKHQGRIEVETAPGQGATFTVELPLVNESSGDPGERVQALAETA